MSALDIFRNVALGPKLDVNQANQLKAYDKVWFDGERTRVIGGVWTSQPGQPREFQSIMLGSRGKAEFSVLTPDALQEGRVTLRRARF